MERLQNVLTKGQLVTGKVENVTRSRISILATADDDADIRCQIEPGAKQTLRKGDVFQTTVASGGDQPILSHIPIQFQRRGLEISKDLKALNRPAIQAFAARCVRRVQPLLRYSWPQAPPGFEVEVEVLLRRLEEAASQARKLSSPTHVDDWVTDHTPNPARMVAVAAKHAHHTAFLPWIFRDDARIAAQSSHDAATEQHAKDAISFAIIHDLELLIGQATENHWNRKSPVPPDVFGPLWPDGPPDGWPIISFKRYDSSDTVFILERKTALPSGLVINRQRSLSTDIRRFQSQIRQVLDAISIGEKINQWLASLEGAKFECEVAEDEVKGIVDTVRRANLQLIYTGRPVTLSPDTQASRKHATINVLTVDDAPQQKLYQKVSFPPLTAAPLS